MIDTKVLENLRNSNEHICALIDGTNMFIRNFCANTAMDKDGNPIGGLLGFLKFIFSFSSSFKVNSIIVCWDGEGGSVRRKNIFSEYKANRKKPKINRLYDYENETAQAANRKFQIEKLMQCMKYIPVTQIIVNNCEADDVISCVTQLRNYGNIIVSDDKDFIQLVEKDKTILYRLSMKKFYDDNEIVSEYGISPNNFLLAKSVIGDVSDNIDGIKGVGIARIKKMVPELSDIDKTYDVNHLIKRCSEFNSKVLSERIRNGREKIIRNCKLMKLDSSMISPNQMDKIILQLNKGHPKYNKIAILNELISLGLNGIDIVKTESFSKIL